jgi:1,4-dihydroxy-2-naphthoate octaprenyltransferase
MTTNNTEPRPPTWKVWLLAARPHTLTASVSPVLVGHSLGLSLLFASSGQHAISDHDRRMVGSLAVRFGVFAALIQLATNLHNDYADFVKGADTPERVGQARATQKGWLTPAQTASGATICLVAALAIGLPLVPPGDAFFLFVILSSVFNAVAYTGGPYPLGYLGLSNLSIGYSGLGDIFVFLYFGMVATMAVPYLVLRKTSLIENEENAIMWDSAFVERLMPAFLVSLPVGFLATGIIVVNNLRDRTTDQVAGKRTTAVRFGETFGRSEYGLLVVGSYAMSLWFAWDPVGTLSLPPSSSSSSSVLLLLLPMLSIPLAIPLMRAVTMGETDGAALNPFVGGTARLQLFYCLSIIIAIRYAIL